jgi:ABC-type sugar transport system permease subunit
MFMETPQSHDDISARKNRSTGGIALGAVFLLPALFCCVTQFLIPTVGTFIMSFQKISMVGSKAEFVGPKNYGYLFGSEDFGQTAGFTFITLIVRLFVVALIPLFFAWAVGQFGRPVRLGMRVVFTLPIVFFVPVAIAITWLMFLNPNNGFFPFEKSWVATPASARSTLLFIDALYFLGLASGLGLMIYLPLWRRSVDAPQPTFREVLKPMLATWGIGILGTIILSLNTFTLNFVLTNGGPARSTTTLGLLLYQFAFRNFNMGVAATIASLLLFIVLVLGIAAGLLVILTRLRLNILDAKPAKEQADQSAAPKRSRALPGIVAALLALLLIGACLFSAVPFGWLIPQAFGKNGLGRLLEQIPVGRVLINTLVPSLITATLQVLVAYLAALGIGALRPFGKRSEWILLLFSPWFFITLLPLSLTDFLASQRAGTLNTFAGSLSPIQLSIPALFILTIFFAGRASQFQQEKTEGESQNEPGFFKHFILPSLPLAGVLWFLFLFFNGQDLLWPLLIGVSPETHTLSVTLLQLAGAFNGASGSLAAAIIFLFLPACIFVFVCLAVFQIFYLDRLTLYTEPLPTAKTSQDPE